MYPLGMYKAHIQHLDSSIYSHVDESFNTELSWHDQGYKLF